MTPELARLEPRYVRLSGEIADQAVLDALRARFPRAPIGHAFASTEAGVCFEVADGREGFPASALTSGSGEVELRVRDASLQVRSGRTALRYLGRHGALRDREGWVDTGDLVERRGDRLLFAGRRSGVINVGGLKVHPETIERVLNRHPAVRMSRASARKSPITGALVSAEVVLADASTPAPTLKEAILAHCRSELPPHMRPAFLTFVDALPISASGKLARAHA
jgi:acyl-coenzyme A synthetase/AMP-(fatty) acid ligase